MLFGLAGKWATAYLHPEILMKITKFALYLERKGKPQTTITTYQKALMCLAQRANLDNQIEVELAIARYKTVDLKTLTLTNKPCSQRWKQQLCTVYLLFCKCYKMEWEKPTYKSDKHSIQPPTEEKIKMLIAAAHTPLSIKIDISMQTGLRPIEIQSQEKGLKVKDIHLDTKTITAANAKGCDARPPIPISEQLAVRLSEHIFKNKLQADDHLFVGQARNFPDHFRRLKNRLARELSDQSFKSIRLYDLRHYYITKLLRQLQNPEIVRQKVGHKSLDTTQKYIHLLDNDINTEWITEQTNDRKRADQLVHENWTYCFTTPDGYMQFKKPK
jgi:integrase